MLCAGTFTRLLADLSPVVQTPPYAGSTSVSGAADSAISGGPKLAAGSAAELESLAPFPNPPPPVGEAPPANGSQSTNPSASPSPGPAEGNSQIPQVDVEPPLPEDETTQTVAQAVPLPANPPLREQFSDYDLAGIQSPLFETEAINDFAERPINITGAWSLKFHLSVDTLYDGNIFLRSQNQNIQSDFITRIAPGATIRLGDTDSMFYLVADYTAGFNIYVTHPNQSDVDQDFSTSFQWSLPKTTITVRAGIFSDTGEDVDVTDLVRRQLYDCGIAMHYQFSDKTSFDFSGDYTRTDFDGLISSSQVEGQAFVNYDYSPKTQVGIGATVGYLEVPGGSDQTFEQGNLRMTERVSGKLTLIAEVGGEVRQYDHGGAQTFTPVASIEGTWQARPGTEVDLTVQRSIYPSAILQDQDYTSTEVDLGIRQRVGDRVTVGLTGGYVNLDYSAAAAGVDATRNDNYFYLRPTIEWAVYSWLSIGIFYEYDKDLSSGETANGFTRDRGGVDFAILF